MAICLASGVNAQFSDSEQVYIYEYQYTINSSGVKTGEDDPNPTIEFVIFKKGCIGGYIDIYSTSKNSVREKGGTSYYEENARKIFAENYNKFYSSSPATNQIYAPTMYVYDNSLSKANTYTYRQQEHNIRCLGFNPYFGYQYEWAGTTWKSKCYSFSTDKKEMIRWSTSSDGRTYWKLIDANAYKPNTDFITW